MSASRGHEKQAGAMVYLMEELGDARLRCDQLQRYVAKATKLVDQSDHKDHFFEVAGDLIRGIPETVFKLHKSLQAVALAAGRIDYEEIKQDLRPEKAEELERVLKDVRIRHVQRRSEPMKPIDALNALKTLKAKVEATGKFPITETLNLIAALEEDEKEEGSAKEASSPAHSFDLLSRMLTNPPEGSKGPSRQRLAQILRSIVGSSINREDLTAFRVATLFEEREAGQKLDFRDLNNLKKYLEDIVVEAKKNKNSDIEDLAQKAIKQMKMASDDEDDSDKTAADEKDAADDITPMSETSVQEGIDKIKASVIKLSAAGDNWKKVLFHTIGVLDGVARIGTGFDLPDVGYLARFRKTLVKNSGARPSTNFASSEDKEGRFEEGKPADPTKDMSPEDAKKWKEHVDHDGSNIKKAGRLPSLSDLTKKMKDSASSILKTRVLVRELGDMLQAVEEDATGAGISYSGSTEKVTSLRKKLRDLDSEMGVYDFIEAQMKAVKSLSKTAAWKTDEALDFLKEASDDEDKEGRFEEGKPADPTKDMSPEDAKKWKENTDEYGDKFKKEAADISKLERIFGNIERQVKEFKYSLGIFKKDPGKNAPQMKNIEDALDSIRQSAQAALRATSKSASDDEGEDEVIDSTNAGWKSADWKVEAKKTSDDFEKGDIVRWTAKFLRNTGQQVSKTIDGKVIGPASMGKDYLKVHWNNYEEPTTVAVANIELHPRFKKKKEAGDDDKQSRFEEGESADPTENMSPEDAKKWKENTDEYGDKFKKEAKAKIDEAAMTNLKSVKVSVDNILKGQNPKRNSFTAVQLLGEALEVMGQDKVSEALYTTANKINSLWSTKDMADYKKASSDPWKAV